MGPIYKKQLISSINDLDVIKITNCSGSIANGTLVLKKIIRAKSYQPTPKVKIGDPIALMQLPGVVSQRTTKPVQRVPGLVDSICSALDHHDEPSNQKGTANYANDNIDDEPANQDGMICEPDNILG